MRFSRKIMMMPVVSGLAFFVIFAIMLLATRESEKSMVAIQQEYFHALELSHQLETSALEIRHQLTEAVTTRNEDLVAEADIAARSFMSNLDYCEAMSNTPKASLDTLRTAFDDYFSLARDITLSMVANANEEELDFSESMLARVLVKNSYYENLLALLTRMVYQTNSNLEIALQDIRALIQNTQRKMKTTSIVFIAILFFMSLAAVASIVRPVQRMSKVAIAIASGDMEQKIDYRSKDALGELAECFREMQNSLIAEFARREAAENELISAQGTIIQSEKMAVLGNLVAGLTHELNTPLGTLLSSVDLVHRGGTLVQSRLTAPDAVEPVTEDPKFKKAVLSLERGTKNAKVAADRIGHLVNGLKAFSQLDKANYQQTNINDGVDSALTLLEHHTKHDVEIKTDLAELPTIFGYPAQLNQLFLTLLRRAVDDVESPGTVSVQTRHTNSNIEFSVSDTGAGYSEEALSSLFKPGFKAEDDHMQMDWGLIACSGIVERHGGTLKAESTLGQGSVFTVTIPLDKL